MPGVFPDYAAPIVRNGAEGRELASARWGMPSSSKALMDATKGRKPRLVVAVALANKTARVAWAVMSRQDIYRHAAVAA
jgi:hypothetical protein